MTKVYHRTYCMSGDVRENFFIMVNEVKKNNAPETIISPPVLWLQHEELGIKIEQFSDAPMPMLLLGVTKHLMAHVDRLFGNKNFSFRKFCGIISKHIKLSKDIFLGWCPITGFAEAESISTTGWQSAQYVAFSHLSLVYFGLLEDFKDDLDEKNSKHFDRSLFFGSFSFRLSFQKMFLSRTMLMTTFGYFYPLVYAMGCQLKKNQTLFIQKREK
jgi:hypothetical protein